METRTTAETKVHAGTAVETVAPLDMAVNNGVRRPSLALPVQTLPKFAGNIGSSGSLMDALMSSPGMLTPGQLLPSLTPNTLAQINGRPLRTGGDELTPNRFLASCSTLDLEPNPFEASFSYTKSSIPKDGIAANIPGGSYAPTLSSNPSALPDSLIKRPVQEPAIPSPNSGLSPFPANMSGNMSDLRANLYSQRPGFFLPKMDSTGSDLVTAKAPMNNPAIISNQTTGWLQQTQPQTRAHAAISLDASMRRASIDSRDSARSSSQADSPIPRGRKRRGTDAGSSDAGDSGDRDEPEEVRRQRFLERNRQAALKCRHKKKVWVDNLVQRVESLTAQNQELELEANSLKEEIFRLKQILQGHSMCSLGRSMNHVDSSAMRLAPARQGMPFSSVE